MEESYQPSPLMSSAKHQRIVLWRDQVASAVSEPRKSRHMGTPSLASSNTSTSMSSESTSRSCPRSLWKRLSSHFSIRSSSLTRRDSDQMEVVGGGGGDGLAMYHYQEPRGGDKARMAGLNMEDDPAMMMMVGDDDDGMVVPGDDHSSRGRGGFKDKQERLRRAARLLNGSTSRRH